MPELAGPSETAFLHVSEAQPDTALLMQPLAFTRAFVVDGVSLSMAESRADRVLLPYGTPNPTLHSVLPRE